ncbi:hypothetical protein HGRIS_005257 [Hohenbuehelia grisea]|uniref:Uncharacterized protein n=1 Tax=Hohenbuehelia grisea TaxID=104357 RepID=A0ABR3JEY0_9AGAR
MTAAPEYSIATQAMIPCALAALHNFITIHDPDDFADEGLLDGQRGPRDTSWTLREVEGDERSVFPPEELGDASLQKRKHEQKHFVIKLHRRCGATT